MVTSDSDTDFESADEEVSRKGPLKRDTQITYWTSNTIGSDSDDDTEYVQHPPRNARNSNWQRKRRPNLITGQEALVDDKNVQIDSNVKGEDDTHKHTHTAKSVETFNSQKDASSTQSEKSASSTSAISVKDQNVESMVDNSTVVKSDDTMPKAEGTKAEKASEVKRKRNLSHRLDTKKLATRITKDSDDQSTETQCLTECSNKGSVTKNMECEMQRDKNQPTDDRSKLTGINDLSELDMPEELKSSKKFKEVFQPEGWEGLGDDIELPNDMMEEKLEPVLERLSLANKESEGSLANWGSWGNWGVTSLLDTATASVSTLTNHVSQGLTLLENTLENTMGLQEPIDLEDTKQDETDRMKLDGTIWLKFYIAF